MTCTSTESRRVVETIWGPRGPELAASECLVLGWKDQITKSQVPGEKIGPGGPYGESMTPNSMFSGGGFSRTRMLLDLRVVCVTPLVCNRGRLRCVTDT